MMASRSLSVAPACFVAFALGGLTLGFGAAGGASTLSLLLKGFLEVVAFFGGSAVGSSETALDAARVLVVRDVDGAGVGTGVALLVLDDARVVPERVAICA
jgi:hypothetical protein